MKYTAVAFDLDGTLYPNFSLNSRLIPFLIKEQNLLRAMGKARTRLRKDDLISGRAAGENPSEDFYETQARIMGEILNEPAEIIRERTERLIYRGWEPLFKKIDPFPYVREVLDVFRKEGIKMGLLSDFPPETKLLEDMSTTQSSAQGLKVSEFIPYCPKLYVLPSAENPKSIKTAVSPPQRGLIKSAKTTRSMCFMFITISSFLVSDFSGKSLSCMLKI